jgi:hypothetical protein
MAKAVGIALLVTGAIVSGGTSLLAPYAMAMTIGGSIVYGVAAQREAADAARSRAAAALAAFIAGLKDRLATSISVEQYHRTLYGLNKVGGNIVAIFTHGAHDEFKTCVVVFANHEINAYTKFYVAGKFVGPLNSDGLVTGGVFYDSSPVSITTAFTTTMQLDANYLPASVNVYYTPTDSTVASTPVAHSISGRTLTVATGINATVSYQYTQATTAGVTLAVNSTGTLRTDYLPSTVVAVDGDGNPIGFTLSGTTISIAGGSSATVTYSYPTGSKLAIRQHLGTAGEAADPYLLATYPTKWTSQHTLDGHAYCVFTLDLRQGEFQGGPPTFQAEIQGKKLFDPRNSLTTYSDNNALVLLDYLTGPYLNIPRASLPLADYVTAANDCDDVVRTGATAPQSNLRYTFNGTIRSDESAKKVLEQIAQSMCGTIDGNNWSVYAGKYRAPVMTISQDDCVGGLTINPGLGFQGTYNTVRGQYSCPTNDYVVTDFTPLVNTAYLAADGQEINLDSTQQYTNNLTGVYSIERIKMEDSRNGLHLTGDFSYKTWALRPGDRVLFNSTLLGMTNKIFRITDKAVKFGSPVRLTMKEDDPTIWDQENSTVADATPNTTLGDPFAIPDLPGLTAASGTSTLLRAITGEILARVLITWTSANYQGATAVDIQWRRHVSDNWESLSTTTDSTSTYLTGVIEGEGYVIRARLRSVSLNAVGDWTYIDHTVVGKSSPPSDVTGLGLSISTTGVDVIWDKPADLDYDYTEIRLGTVWATATILDKKLALSHSIPWTGSGTLTVLARHVDTSGNLSAGTTVETLAVTAPNQVTITRSNVEVNTVALGWNDAKASQPIKSYSIYTGLLGDSLAACTLYGKAGSDSRSDIVIFTSAGAKRIYLVAEDLAGNTGTPAMLDVSISLPTNYILSSTWDEDWSGTKVNAYVDSGALYLPVPNQDWATHYSSNGWATSDDQVSAGYPLYFEPGSASGSYQEEHDIGRILSNAKIVVVVQSTTLSGSATPTVQIEWRDSTSSSWIAGGVGLTELQTNNFRYVRVTYSVVASGSDDLVRLSRVNVTVSSQDRSETAAISVVSTDTNGTAYTTTKGFLDVVSAVFTPTSTTLGGTSPIAKWNVYIDDSAAPATPAKVYVMAWDSSNTRVSGTGSLQIGGY